MAVGNVLFFAVSLLALAAVAASIVIYRRKVTFDGLLQFLAAACIIGAFGDISLELERKVPLAVYALDVSESYSARRLNALEIIRTHASGLGPSAQVALVSFGSSAVLDGPFDASSFTAKDGLGAGIGRGETNIEAGLGAASVLGGRAERVYLFSDGRANKGETDRGVLLCSQEGIKVCPVVLDSPPAPDAWVGRVYMPSALSPGEAGRVLAGIGSNQAGRVEVSLSDGLKRAVQVVELPGRGASQNVEFVLRYEEPGIKRVEVHLRTLDFADSYPGNNSARRAVRVLGPPRLLVYSTGFSAAADVLGRMGVYATEHWRAEDIPESLGELRDAAAVVLDNVSAYRLTRRQMGVLQCFVRDLGGGLIVLGGPSSFGPGGYSETPLEQALPVWCSPEKRKNVSLVLLLDASGSMFAQTIFLGERMSKFRAALRAVSPVTRELKKGDRVSIITFNVQPTVELGLGDVGDGAALRETITALMAQKEQELTGRTNIYPALREALRMLEKEESGERVLHVVLLSDGRQTVEDSMDTGQFRRAGISVSTVATGSQVDRRRLREIADSTEGRYYEVAKFDATLRDAFVQELPHILRLTRTGDIKVELKKDADFLAGIDALRPLGGIVLTTPKDEAHVVAESAEGEPVLAWWRLGLGKTVAFTGGLNRDWGGAYLKWKDLGKLLSQIVRWSAKGRENPDLRLSASVNGLVVRAHLKAETKGEFVNGLRLRCVFSCNGARREEAFLQTGPGEYEATAQAQPDSLCVITAYTDSGSTGASAEVWVPGTLESGPAGPDMEELSRIAASSGGEVLREEAFLDDSPQGRGGRHYEIWWVLLMLAGCFFLADIAHGSVLSLRKGK